MSSKASRRKSWGYEGVFQNLKSMRYPIEPDTLGVHLSYFLRP